MGQIRVVVVVVVKAQVVEWAVHTGGGHYRQEEEDGGAWGRTGCASLQHHRDERGTDHTRSCWISAYSLSKQSASPVPLSKVPLSHPLWFPTEPYTPLPLHLPSPSPLIAPPDDIPTHTNAPEGRVAPQLPHLGLQWRRHHARPAA